MDLARLSALHLNGRPRPVPRILQFGGGNFLRGFMDWKIDRLNEAVGSDWGIVVLRSIGSTEGSALNAQDGLYTVVSRGMGADGGTLSESRLVASVLGELSCTTEWGRVLELARNPAIEVVLSNTTEAGIVYLPGTSATDAPPASFPAKVARLLLERWWALGAVPGSGWQILPCELTENCGDRLRDIVLQHAQDWGVGAECVDWIARDSVFFNTLVDRIVTGYPGAEAADAIERTLGYRDPCLTTAELFHLLVIEVPEGTASPKLRLADHDSGTVEVPDAAPYRLRKVAILNGGHTALCPLALMCGVETVGEAVRQPALLSLLHQVLDHEIKPFVPLPAAELDRFAEDVLRRFANPFIQHRWYDISLNGLAKYRDRSLARLIAHQDRYGQPAPVLTLSLAAWLAFYLGRFAGAERFAPRDSPATLAEIAALAGETEGLALAQAFLSNAVFWGRSVASPMLVAAVARDFEFLTRQSPTPDALLAWIVAQTSARPQT